MHFLVWSLHVYPISLPGITPAKMLKITLTDHMFVTKWRKHRWWRRCLTKTSKKTQLKSKRQQFSGSPLVFTSCNKACSVNQSRLPRFLQFNWSVRETIFLMPPECIRWLDRTHYNPLKLYYIPSEKKNDFQFGSYSWPLSLQLFFWHSARQSYCNCKLLQQHTDFRFTTVCLSFPDVVLLR